MAGLTMFTGVLDAGAGDRMRSAIARAAGIPPGRVTQIGPLLIAAPTADSSGTVAAVFSGELHNRDSLAERLGLGPTTAPAAVLAAGYAREGRTFLSSLRGAYQLGLWDAETRTGLITADHLGARAIFYTSADRRLCFGADIVDLAPLLDRALAPDPEVVPRWITDRALPPGITLYAGVRRLPLGHSLELGGPVAVPRPLWRPRYVQPPARSQEAAESTLLTATRRAVTRRLDPQRRTGILLSGGFDSATIAGLACQVLDGPERLHTYSTVFPGSPWDESAEAATVADALGLTSTRRTVSGGTLTGALGYQARWALPQPAPGAVLDGPLLRQASADGLEVMLDGQGGDELFMSSVFLLADDVLSLRLARAWRLAHRFPETGRRLAVWQARALIRQVIIAGGIPRRWHTSAHAEYDRMSWLTPRSRELARAVEDPWAWKERVGEGPRWWAWLSHTLVEAREIGGMQDFLRRRGLLAGIDSRQPLLTDVDLVETVLSLPPAYAFAPEHDRALARSATRGIVPDAIRLPPRKSRYGALMSSLLSRTDLPAVRRLLSAPDAELGAYVDLAAVRSELLDRPGAETTPDWSEHIWSLATTELWLRGLALGDDFTRWTAGLELVPLTVRSLH